MSTQDPFDISRYCAALPEPEVPAHLQGGVERAYSRRNARRRCVVATFLVAAIGLTGTWLLSPGEPMPSAPASRSALAPPPTSPDALRDLDRQLQAAYDAGANDDQLAELWSRRAALARPLDPDAVPLSL